MAGSLRDQFLKAGLVSEKQAKQARHDSARSRKKGGPPSPQPAAAAGIEEERRAKVERDRALNQQLADARRAKDAEGQVRQLVERHRLSLDGGDTPFSVQDGRAVRTLLVSEAVRAGLVSGALAVVGTDSGLSVVPASAAARIEERDPSRIKAWSRTAAERDAAAADDPYASYFVPDDIVW